MRVCSTKVPVSEGEGTARSAPSRPDVGSLRCAVDDPRRYLVEQDMSYEPPVVEEFGTVTEATLGTNKKEGVDDTEYWH